MIVGLDPYVTDWLDLLVRWLHVIAAIVWIGTSFYFVALDSHLLPLRDRRRRDDGVGGEAWEVHGGGFYRVEKYGVAPRALPEPLHWFRWEAYTTWLSGLGLFVLLYYLDAETYLVDPGVADLSTGAAVGISLGLLGAAWLVYDLLCRALERSELVLAAAITGAVVAAAYALSELYSARGYPIQLGAMLGTIMAANVLLVIIPAQREVVRAKQAAREPDPAPGLRGKQRSVHNNYLTLPVLLTMLAPHFPFLTARKDGWAVLVGLMALGAWIRVFFNLRHAGRNVWAIPATAALGVAAIAVAIRPDDGKAPVPGPVPAFREVQAVVEQRCTPCHSSEPSNPSFDAPPAGVAFDTAEEIRSRAGAIEEQAVRSRAMPLGNVTGMTQTERDLLGRWIEGQ